MRNKRIWVWGGVFLLIAGALYLVLNFIQGLWKGPEVKDVGGNSAALLNVQTALKSGVDSTSSYHLPSPKEKEMDFIAMNPVDFLKDLMADEEEMRVIPSSPRGWIRYEHIRELMQYIDDEKECPQIWSSTWVMMSSLPPEGKSTVSNEVMYLIDGFIEDAYPPKVYSKTRGEPRNADQYKEWFQWYEDNIHKHMEEMSTEESLKYYNSLYLSNSYFPLHQDYLSERMIELMPKADWFRLYELDQSSAWMNLYLLYEKASALDNEALPSFLRTGRILEGQGLTVYSAHLKALMNRNLHVVLHEMTRLEPVHLDRLKGLIREEASKDPSFEKMLREAYPYTSNQQITELLSAIFFESEEDSLTIENYRTLLEQPIDFPIEDELGRFYYTETIRRNHLDGTYSSEFAEKDFEIITDFLISFEKLAEKTAKSLSQKERDEIGNLDGGTQTLGLGNVPTSLRGGLADMNLILKKLDFELAIKKFEDQEITKAELDEKREAYLKAKNAYEEFIAEAFFRD